ncbi:hypothetical protein BC831DRAFT_452342 [Entophlyctis helioformis]|nr:hypothetical protein BC831DRAFT_452342 [Entophlyctis helioformis]
MQTAFGASMLQGMPGMLPAPGMKAQRTPKAPPPTTPQSTLYVRNLHEALSLKKVKLALTALFSKYGDVVDIKLKRNIHHRGQAFVSFKDIETASRAKAEIHGFPLFGKPMDIQYAREPAYAISELQGTIDEHRANRKRIMDERKLQEATNVAKKKKVVVAEEVLPPNSILFVQNLPTDITEPVLAALFRQFPGFKEVRLVPNRSDISFVEYENEMQSAIAKQALHGFRISADNEIKVTFAKR